MLYPMAQSFVLVCVEKVKKMPPQGRCPLSSSSSLITIKNHFGGPHLSVALLAQPTTPQRASSFNHLKKFKYSNL
jgi:hypothetical protein